MRHSTDLKITVTVRLKCITWIVTREIPGKAWGAEKAWHGCAAAAPGRVQRFTPKENAAPVLERRPRGRAVADQRKVRYSASMIMAMGVASPRRGGSLIMRM